MTDLEKSLHEVLHYLSRAADEAKSSALADAWMDIHDCQMKIGKVLRDVEQHNKTPFCKPLWVAMSDGYHYLPCRYYQGDKCPFTNEKCGYDLKNAEEVTSIEFSRDIDSPGRYQTSEGEWHEGMIR